MEESKTRTIREKIYEWGQRHYKNFPWRSTNNPFHGLVAEILLQRTRAESVVPVYQEFVERFESPEELAAAPVEDIKSLIYPLGLHWRAPLLHRLGQALAQRSSFPSSIDELKDLPGVGDYTANAWMSFHGGKRGVLIDSNTVRLFARLSGRERNGETRRKKWLRTLADKVTPSQSAPSFNYALLDFTMNVCMPANPKCAQCPIGISLCEEGRERLDSPRSQNADTE